MSDELSKQYNPQESQDKWYKLWTENSFFSARLNPAKKPFSIVIPPPNVTGILHMGHALNNTIQDILIRYQRMKGMESLWMPGTDHAGIATQNVVEKSLAKQGYKRHDLGRDKFIEKVWQWKEEYGSTIIHQLKKLGASCDWSRIRFTMDPDYSRSVTEVFIRLYEKGLIYRGSYIINWCPRCCTALSDEEALHQQLQGELYYLKYPIKANYDSSYIVVATTRPETILGDSAVAVNPKDKRYKKLIGKTLILPLAQREIKIIADNMVDMEFGTGAVKVTPAHDPNDYLLGKKHNLEFINILHPDGRMNELAGSYSGMDRFKAREAILNDLKENGLLDQVKPHVLSAGHCYRCHTIIEPYLSEQWFVKMKPLAKPAIEAVKKGKIKFYPQRWTKVYLNWMENIQDWCISRQIWWGHRLPVYYCNNCQGQTHKPLTFNQQSTNRTKTTDCGLPTKSNKGIIVSSVKPEKCPDCLSSDIHQDEDVLDTWFSSWLWPFATFYWPFDSVPVGGLASEPIKQSKTLARELKYFYPTSVLVTAPEIIFFWVARMIMAGLEFIGDIPFKDVYIHGTVRDIEGKKMSKSLGNIIDPLEIINEYGVDALRFSLISITAQGQDVFLSKERFEQGRNFANKIWNASRFILMNKDNSAETVPLSKAKEELSLANRWILSRFYSTVKEVDKNLGSYKFNEAANSLYAFFWHEFCDWYLELIKPILTDKTKGAEYKNTQAVMHNLLEGFLKIMHPFMPFISEEIWQILTKRSSQDLGGFNSIMLQSIPQAEEKFIDKKLEKEAQSLFDLIAQIRNLRSCLEIKPEEKVKVSCFCDNKAKQDFLKEHCGLVMNLARLESLDFLSSNHKPASTISAVTEGLDLYLHFSGLLDLSKEQEKIKEKIGRLEDLIKGKRLRLANNEFIKKAPEEIVQQEKESMFKLENELERQRKMYAQLQR
jgi:valyl-tRNA synthetase